MVIDGVPWRAANPLPGIGWELQSKGRPHQTRILTTDEYQALKDDKRVVLISEIQSFAALASLTPSQRDTAFIRSFWMEVVDDGLAEGTISKVSRGQLETLIEAEHVKVAERWKQYREESDFDHGQTRKKKKFGSVAPGKKAQSGDVDPDRLRPCAKTLAKLYDKWVGSGRDFWKLVPHSNCHAEGGKPIDDRTWAVIKSRVEEYASEKQPTLRGICERINIDILGLNAALGEEQQIPDATVYGVAKAIAELPAAVVIGGRLGKKRMIQELKHVGKGPSYKRVGEMTLHDCWSTHVFTLLNEKAKKLFNSKELQVRLTLAVVMDAASGAIVGIKQGLAENSELTRSALRMAMSDKSAIAKAAGCLDNWDMRIGIEEVKSDSGGAYRNSAFMSTAYALVDRLTYTAAGRANLRGQIERLFRTMDVGFITQVTGRTGSNVHSRGRDEQDPEERASLFVEKFMKLVIRYIVDVYHFRARQKGQMSPARKFQEIQSRIQTKAAPTPDEMRVAFGTVLQRDLNRSGIRFMNLTYHSGWLDIYMRQNGPQKDLPIKVDEQDLGHISVLLGQDWTTIPGPREMAGVALNEWVEKNHELARRHGEQARLDFRTYVAPAMLDIEREAKQAEEFFKLEDVNWTADMIDKLEVDLRMFVLYDRDPVGDEAALTRNSAVLGSVYTRSTPASSPTSGLALTPPAADPQLPTSEAVEVITPLKRNRPKKDRK